ncbi:hypothetical protein LUU34_00045900 [Aix galericulata]|nr:hypothetical protein LUU34_00045900 [Aix galericulata]
MRATRDAPTGMRKEAPGASPITDPRGGGGTSAGDTPLTALSPPGRVPRGGQQPPGWVPPPPSDSGRGGRSSGTAGGHGHSGAGPSRAGPGRGRGGLGGTVGAAPPRLCTTPPRGAGLVYRVYSGARGLQVGAVPLRGCPLVPGATPAASIPGPAAA